MLQFNPDGSIKLPERVAKQKDEHTQKLKTQKCIKIEKDVVRSTAPKMCKLHITLSDAITDNRFVGNIYDEFKQRETVPSKITKFNENQFDVEIGTTFKRCTECCSLVNEYREFLYGNLIEKKGNCPFEGRKKSFCYEDHFE